ncbi:hypothetical protein Btru_071702 [Bulinus truncatus]|nr:hypothetical protein Btru_071702 [Bulinus truncatus]
MSESGRQRVSGRQWLSGIGCKGVDVREWMSGSGCQAVHVREWMSESGCQGVDVRQCMSESGCQRVDVREWMSGSGWQGVDVRERMSGSGCQGVVDREWMSGSGCQGVGGREWMSESGYQAVDVRQWLSGSGWQGMDVRQWMAGNGCQRVDVREWMFKNISSEPKTTTLIHVLNMFGNKGWLATIQMTCLTLCLNYLCCAASDGCLKDGQSLQKRIIIPEEGVSFTHHCYPDGLVSDADIMKVTGCISRDGLLADRWTGLLEVYVEPNSGASYTICVVDLVACTSSDSSVCQCTDSAPEFVHFSVNLTLTAEVNNSRLVVSTADEVNFTAVAATVVLEREW